MGSQWLQSRRGALLQVPSAATPAGLEHCAILNPLHGLSQYISLIDQTTTLYNERTFSGI